MRTSSHESKWTVDWGGEGAPEVGHVVHRFTATQQDAGYWRVTSERPVMNRKPLPKGYVTRYIVTARYIGDELEYGQEVDWCLYVHPRKKRSLEDIHG